MPQDGDIEEEVAESSNVAKVPGKIARPRKVGSGAPGALRGRRGLVRTLRVRQRALPDVATLLKGSMPSALGPPKETATRPSAHKMASKHDCPVSRQMFEDTFDLTIHMRTHNGPARTYSRARKVPKSPAVFKDAGHQTQVNRKQTEDTFTLKPNGHSGKQVRNVSELASIADSHSGHKNESLMQHIVTVKEDTEDRCFEKGESAEAAPMGLYKDHQIKDELALGLVLQQPRDVAFIVQNNYKKEPTSSVDSPTANDEESLSQDSVTVKVEREERCFNVGVTEAIGADHLKYQISDHSIRFKDETVSQDTVTVKVEPEERWFDVGVTEAIGVDHLKYQISDHLISFKDETVSQDTVTVKVEPEERCFDVGVTEAIRVDNLEYPITNELVRDERCFEDPITNNKDTVTVKVEPEDRCFDEKVMEAAAVDHLEHPLKCNHCDYTTSYEVLLCQHLITHTGDQPDKHGDVNNGGNGQLTIQSRTHTGVKPRKCSHCDYVTHNHCNLRRHQMKHTPFKCSHCEFTSHSKRGVDRHQSKHNSEKPFKCSHCDYATYYYSLLRGHVVKHSYDLRFKCSHCDYTSHYHAVAMHQLEHKSAKPFKCSHCNYSSRNKRALTQHQLLHMSNKPSHCDDATSYRSRLRQRKIKHECLKCSHCDFTAFYRSILAKHELTHGEPFKCSHCTYTSYSKSKVTKHELRHKEPYKCSYCDYTACYKNAVTKHELRHREPFKCSHCDFAAAHLYLLRKHEIKHIKNDEPFQCLFCDYTDLSKDVVLEHQRTHDKLK